MKAGVIGLIDGDFNAVSSFSETVREDGHELTRALEITKVFSLGDGHPAFRGHAVREELTTANEMEISYGSIDTEETVQKTQRYTQLAGIAGEFVVVDGSRGAFAFDLIADDTNTDIERATVDLDAFLEKQSDPHPWKAGFDSENGIAKSGVLYGDDLFADDSIAHLLEDSSLNQLGLEYEYGGDDLKMTATSSGYLEVYQPSSFETGAFLEYLSSELGPHLQ